MKLIILLLIALLSSALNLRKRQNNPSTIITSTPKANDLGNHNGLPVNNNTYGPQNIPSGENHMNVISPEGKIDHIVVLDSQINKAQLSDCAVKTEHYNLCSNITDCDICSSSKFCGILISLLFFIKK